jgi:hypothetical protein
MVTFQQETEGSCSSSIEKPWTGSVVAERTIGVDKM